MDETIKKINELVCPDESKYIQQAKDPSLEDLLLALRKKEI